MSKEIGYIHSIETFGTLDGPGIRFVVFMQGCNLRCGCCHNPDTWLQEDFKRACSAEEIFRQYQKYEMYYGCDGGITVSGGEPLLQAKFVTELFTLCRAHNVHTCLDTSGSLLNSETKDVLSVTDLVLLDIKYTNEQDYKKYVGCSYQTVLHFLAYLEEQQIDTWIRQVIITDLNDNDANIFLLGKLISSHNCVTKYQLLPFHKMCIEKYEKLDISFPFSHITEPSKEQLQALTCRIDAFLNFL